MSERKIKIQHTQKKNLLRLLSVARTRRWAGSPWRKKVVGGVSGAHPLSSAQCVKMYTHTHIERENSRAELLSKVKAAARWCVAMK
jgi:hypothetical protein